MLPMDALKKKAKEKAFEHLIGVMRGLESKENEPEEHQNQEADVLNKMHDMIEPDEDTQEPEAAIKPEDDENNFDNEKSGFMKRSNKNPAHVRGKAKLIMAMAETRPKMGTGGFKKKGY